MIWIAVHIQDLFDYGCSILKKVSCEIGLLSHATGPTIPSPAFQENVVPY